MNKLVLPKPDIYEFILYIYSQSCNNFFLYANKLHEIKGSLAFYNKPLCNNNDSYLLMRREQ